MDQRASDTRRDIEGARAVMTEKIGMVEERAQETMEGVKSTVDQAMEGFKQVQETVEGAKSTVDTIIESVKLTMDEAVERVKGTADLADLIDQVQQHPWLMLGSAILLGYILGGLARNTSSASGQMPDRPRPDQASAHDGHEPSEVHQQASGSPTAVMQCSTCGQMVRQADMASHSATCVG
jgi:ElaB/YqjD/DUF883 family membrane-anchored ribosome-binding protein